MRTYWFVILLAVTFVPAGLWGQASAGAPAVLHILQSQTTSQPGFPTFLGMYHVLDGGNSPAGAIALSGTLSLTNSTPRFSEVLWDLVFWSGECPAHDLTLTGATIIWSDIADDRVRRSLLRWRAAGWRKGHDERRSEPDLRAHERESEPGDRCRG